MVFASYDGYVACHDGVIESCHECIELGCSNCDGKGFITLEPSVNYYFNDLMKTTKDLIEWVQPKDPLKMYGETISFFSDQGFER